MVWSISVHTNYWMNKCAILQQSYTMKSMNWLEQQANLFLQTHFNLLLSIPIIINGRLKRVLGVFRLNPDRSAKQIELSKTLIESNNEEIILDVLYHELIHYGLHQLHKPFKDSSKEFKQYCQGLGVSLTRTYTGTNTHRYHCACKTHLIHRKLQLKKGYYCPLCNTQLKYMGPIKTKITKIK